MRSVDHNPRVDRYRKLDTVSNATKKPGLGATAQQVADHNQMLLDRALGILHRMATEKDKYLFSMNRWYYPDEPLRNDAANLIREAEFEMPRPEGTHLVGD